MVAGGVLSTTSSHADLVINVRDMIVFISWFAIFANTFTTMATPESDFAFSVACVI